MSRLDGLDVATYEALLRPSLLYNHLIICFALATELYQECRCGGCYIGVVQSRMRLIRRDE